MNPKAKPSLISPPSLTTFTCGILKKSMIKYPISKSRLTKTQRVKGALHEAAKNESTMPHDNILIVLTASLNVIKIYEEYKVR
mmetsp:Transcript_29331/g.29064  ORF Transcript_29331/g.29064 Transcript_29331/m.29064 type:complete len:83 (+) Transcript_29331:481-729(+)